MMHEVVGGFACSRRLSEALEELGSEGISADRIRIETTLTMPNELLTQSVGDRGATTHWRSAEYAGHGEHLGVVDFHDYVFEATDPVYSEAKIHTSLGIEDNDHATITVWVDNEVELRVICDIFSRLGVVDVEAAKLVA